MNFGYQIGHNVRALFLGIGTIIIVNYELRLIQKYIIKNVQSTLKTGYKNIGYYVESVIMT